MTATQGAFADALFAVRSGRNMQLPAVTERASQRMDKPEYCALQDLGKLYPSLPTLRLFAAVLRKKLRRPAQSSRPMTLRGSATTEGC